MTGTGRDQGIIEELQSRDTVIQLHSKGLKIEG